ncbi:MAG TPA: MG2 domain-containing protein, partial [Longimicrobiales bacterium]|nr:MG2 domain-containing protein [Longimicrobiales bacterium]
MSRTDLTRLFAPIILAAATLLSCTRGAPPRAGGPVPAVDLEAGALAIPPLPLPPAVRPVEDGSEPGLTFRLREGEPDGTPRTPAEPAPSGPSAVQALDAARTARLLARLPALPSPDTVGFRFPPASPPPPRTGRIVLSTFPPPDTIAPPAPAARTASALRVVRVVPTGDTELAPHLTITFSEAMVPLTTVAGTETRTPPVRLTPQPPGRWSWVDTRTLRFQPDERFPMATSYRVEIPAGTRPVTGPGIDTAVVVEFSTPAPRAVGAWPALIPEMTDEDQRRRSIVPRWRYGDDLARSTSRQPVVLIAFDQRVNPEEVLSATRIIAAGLSHPVRLASADEIAADSIVSRMVDELENDRWVAFRPVAQLPADTIVRVVLARGLSSAEGSLSTRVPQELHFRTYGPLRIASHGCGAGCRPGHRWLINFTNPLAEAAWSELVRVEPALDEMSVRVFGTDMYISGAARPNTRYVVTLSPSLTDRFGQTLEGARSVTFEVGAAFPTIALPGAPLIVLDPEGPPRVAFQSRGHDALLVRVYRVTPQQWDDYGAAVERWHQNPAEVFSPPGELVSSSVVSPAASGEITEAMIDVASALRNGLGHAIVAVSPAGTPAVDGPGGRGRNVVHAWVQSTRIGLEATIDAEAAHVWATSLRTGQPLANVGTTLLPTRTRAVTRADGTARLPLTTSGDDALIATLGDDVALLPSTGYPGPRGSRGNWQRRPTGELRWYMLTDRGLYQPGDTLHFKGWLRHMTGSGGSALRVADVDGIRFTMRGPRGEDLGTRSLRPGELGGFNTTVALPEAMNLGHASIQLVASGSDAARMGREAYHAVQVQEFRRPEYEVRVDADPGPHTVGDVIAVTLAADYYGGGGLADAQLDWRVSTQPGSYRPPGWERWHFGRAQWGWAGFSPREPALLSGVTDAAGTHQLLIDLVAVEPPFTTSLRAEAQVHDVTRQIGSAGVDLLVHPAAVNVGMRTERTWLARGQTAEVGVIVVDHDGAEVTGRNVSVVLERIRAGWGMDGSAKPDSGRIVCSVVSGAAPVPCTFTADSSGLHRIRADVTDTDGRISRTELALWVAGEPGLPDPRRQPGSFDVIADREEYQPGDTARILVQPPFYPAEALVTIRSVGVLDARRLRIERPSHELILPITSEHIPNVNVRVDVIDASRGVSRAFGETSLSVPPHTRGLDVRIRPGAALVAPGANVTIDVEVRAADGRAAAGAEVALWMVDEAILGLGDYSLRNPLDAFYAPRYGYMQDRSSRSWVVLWPQSAGPGTLSGVVALGDRGRALAGAVARLAGTDIETVTAWDGSFTLRGIAPGDYVLEITAPDGMTGRRDVHVPAEGAHVGNLILGAAGLGAAREEMAMEAAQAARASDAPVAVAPPPPPPPPGAPPSPQLELQSIVVAGSRMSQQEVDVRTDFAPLAFFAPSLRTDANGRVQVTARLPHTLTRYRIMAVAVSGAERFGTGDAAVTARRDLMVRLSAPRFLNYGDAF